MRVALLISCFIALSECLVDQNPDAAWEKFKEEHVKTYETPEMENIRKAIFVDNLKKIQEHNSMYAEGLKSFKLSVNQFADKTLDEIKNKGLKPNSGLHSLSTFMKKDSKGPIQFEATGAKLPTTVDWREKNIVSPVKTQARCLACWAFAATDAIESQYALKRGQHLLLSQQQLVDCSGPEGNLGCSGGMVDWAYKYIMRAGGLQSDTDYEYKVETEQCKFNSSETVASIANYGEIKNGSEISLQEAVAFYGPISVCIDSNSFEWSYYSEGVYDNPQCSEEVDHAVLIVGYGTEDGKDYWLVKNSYGERFGNKGYIKMARNKGNQCAIASYANFPIIGEWEPFSPSLL